MQIKRLGLRQIFTKPYTPKTNGKAERFIQTALREWAYARAYQNSPQRSAELPHWLHRYNWHRPHASLKAKTPDQPPRSVRGQPVEAPQLARVYSLMSATPPTAAEKRTSIHVGDVPL